MLDLMTLFIEITESDGASVEAHDAGNVVIAALEEWGLLATRVEDLQEESEPAMEAFVEQLESADAGVQIAAGENIALLYEKSYTHVESDEEVSDAEDAEDSDDPEADKEKSKFVKRYQVYRRQDQLLHTLESLSDVSNRRISKKDRKTLHSSFADIHRSVEKPTRGPGYSTAIDKETGKVYGGGRMKLRLNREFAIIIDKWWKLHTYNALKRTLRGGVLQHCMENEAVEALLPVSAVSMRDRRG
ncbi:interferon-related developmental regulator-domain-containing protein [Ampelomyces quisqualis]|uniref:Interferon-related developmental regulator-domain-containing protein n=1 Tax=Ampelomyces quisqualis TaxID=50730 RepID=A0A6A5QRY2_AMPQU|nr:interferon-related developmental regulator-domain-containing protein [Ampelomyces quisqualis]